MPAGERMSEEEQSSILYGADVWDTQGNLLGSVSHIVQDTWSGKVRRFMVRHPESKESVFFEPGDVLEATEDKITVDRTAGDWTTG
jgi:sporulation protein YlmC with PRC-barrel domain